MSVDKPRRLGPLHLDASVKPQSPSEKTRQESAPLKSEHDSAPKLTNERTDKAGLSRSQMWAVIGGIGFGVGGAGMLAFALLRTPKVPDSLMDTQNPAALARSGTGRATVPEWMSLLHGASCSAPCCGGAACAVSPDNSNKGGCKPGDLNCSTCTSGITCIPGDCGTFLDQKESWQFHLSAVVERGTDGASQDPCKTNRDLWLCVRGKSQQTATCLSQVEACQHHAKSSLSAPVTTADLVSDGFDLEVRFGGPNGVLLATKVGAKYTGGLDRRSLCNGLKVKISDSGPVAYATYYLDVDEGREVENAPPSAKASNCNPADWISRVPSTQEGRDARTALDGVKMTDGKVKSLGDLTGDGLPEFEISYTYGVTGWGMTLLSSTGDNTCFHSIYEGVGATSGVRNSTTDGWKDITVTHTAIIGDRGRGVVTSLAQRSGGVYRMGATIECATLGGESILLADCRSMLAR